MLVERVVLRLRPEDLGALELAGGRVQHARVPRVLHDEDGGLRARAAMSRGRRAAASGRGVPWIEAGARAVKSSPSITAYSMPISAVSTMWITTSRNSVRLSVDHACFRLSHSIE